MVNAGSIIGTYYPGFGVFIRGAGYIGNTGTAAVIAGYGGAYVGQAATIDNLGTIESNQYAVGAPNFGVQLADGGTVINSGAASLLYGSIALYIEGAAGTVTNGGQIQATGGVATGIKLTAGGTITNGASNNTGAAIYGTDYGVLVTAGTATIVNYGDISSAGVALQFDGSGTVVTSGTISGEAAISFSGSNDLLVLRPGYVISGEVVAGGASGNTLELQGNIAASVTANYTSLGLTGFQTVAFAPGAGYAELVITNDGELPDAIAGFTGSADSIDLTTLSDADNHATVSFDSSSGVLTVTGDGGSVALQLTDLGGYDGGWAASSDGSGGTLVHPGTNAPNERPSIGGTSGVLGVAAGGSDTPFANVAITDTSPSPTDTVTVTLSNPAGGSLSNLGSGSFNAGTGVYTATGTPAEVNNDLDGLVFTPTAPSAGAVGIPVGFTIAVTGPGGSASDSSTSVTALAQVLSLGTVAPGNVVASISQDGTTFATATVGPIYEAEVADPTVGHVYVLPAGYQAEFLGASSDAVTLSDPSVGNALLVGNTRNNTISSGAANDTLLGGGGTPTLRFTAGASDGVASVGGGNVILLDAGSHDTLTGGTGTTAATLSGSYGTFLGQSGTSSVAASGHGETLTGGSSQAFFQFGTAAASGVVFGGNATLSLVDAGTQDTTLGAFGNSMATLSGGQALFFGTSGAASVLASGHGDTLAGGSGDLAASLSGSNSLLLGNGSFTAIDAGSHDTIAAFGAPSAAVSLTGSHALVLGGSGTLAASVGGGGSDNTVVGGSGATTVTLQGASTLVLGGSGSLSVNDAGGSDTIAGFSASSVTVSVSGAHALLLGFNQTLTASLAGTSATVAAGSAATNVTIENIYYTTGNLVLGGGGGLTVSDAGEQDTIAAFSSSSANVSIGGTRNLVLGGTHGLTASVGGGSDTVIGGGSTTSVVVGGAASGTELFGGGGQLTIQDAGSNDTIAPFGASSAAVTLTGSNTLVFGGSNPMSVDAAGAGATIAAGTGALAVTAGGSSGLLVFGSGAPLNFVGGGGSATVMTGSADATISGGSGGVVLFGGSGGSVTYTGSSGGLDYSAGAGNETLDASTATSNNIMFGGGGADSMVGGQGNDTLVAGSGANTLVGSSNAESQDWFVLFSSNGGSSAHEVVSNFTSNDELLLAGYGSDGGQTGLNSAVSSNGSTTITLSDQTTITFTNIADASALAGRIISF